MSKSVCEHCDAPGPLDELLLCRRCAATEGVRVLYQPHRHWTPAWIEHLRRLARRARARLPLFDPDARTG
ncbi:MAG: hypothetical protein U0840_03955 [Gemmataceae bacterium]